MKSNAQAIGDAAARFGIETHVLRHWEDVGLLHPDRDAGGRRRYVHGDLVRIAVILRNKAAGMSLEQIAVLLDEGAPDRHAVLESHIEDLDRRMREMAEARAMTEHALRCTAHDITACPRFQTHIADVLAGTRAWEVVRSEPPRTGTADAARAN